MGRRRAPSLPEYCLMIALRYLFASKIFWILFSFAVWRTFAWNFNFLLIELIIYLNGKFEGKFPIHDPEMLLVQLHSKMLQLLWSLPQLLRYGRKITGMFLRLSGPKYLECRHSSYIDCTCLGHYWPSHLFLSLQEKNSRED